jgi:hypothetical protein
VKPIASFARLAGFLTVAGGLVFLFDKVFQTSATRLLWAALASVSVCSAACFLNYLWQTYVMRSAFDDGGKRGLLAIGGVCTLALLVASFVGVRESAIAGEKAKAHEVNQTLEAKIHYLYTCTNQLWIDLEKTHTRVDDLEQNYERATLIIVKFRAKFDAEASWPKDLKAAIKQFVDESRQQMVELEADRLNRAKRNSVSRRYL